MSIINVPVYKVREVHHPYPSNVHQQPDMICIQAGKPSFTGEIFDDKLHERNKTVLQVFEGKYSTNSAMISSLNVRLIMFSVHILPFIPLLTYIRDACCFGNGGR